MKIKLVSPQMTLRPMDAEYKRLLAPSISLLVVASLTPREHSVSIEDENAGTLHCDDHPDLVGINVNVDTSPRAYEIARHYRKRNIPVIFGGIHASARPEEALAHGEAVCIGEAEDLWERILSDRTAGRLKRTYSNAHPVDPAKTPIPRWELLDASRYLYTSIVCASRGCPFQCEFCYNSCAYMHHRHRNRPVENVISEIQRLPTKEVMFVDDNFIGNVAWTREFLRAIAPLHLRWHAAVSTNIGSHRDLLDAMRQTGCESLFIGFESINKESIRSAEKHHNHTDRYEQLVEEIHSRGIMINASMVFGFDHDYPDVFENTLSWLVRNKIETVTAHILTPYPGTRLQQRLEQEKRIIDYDGTHYNTSHVVYTPKHMTPEQLYQGYLWLYREFYSYKNILRRLPKHREQRLPYLLFNLIYRKYGKVTSRIARLGFMNSVGKLARRLSYGIE